MSEEDVATVLATLRAEVRARRQALSGTGENSAAFSAIEHQLQRCVEQLEITRVVSAHWSLEAHTVLERVLRLLYRFMRRGLRWYINPIVEQQNAFNDVTTRTLRLLIEGYSDVRNQLAALEASQAGLAEQPPPVTTQHTTSPTATTQSSIVSSRNTHCTSARSDTETPTFSELQNQVEQYAQTEPDARFPELALPLMPAQLALGKTINAHWHLPSDTRLQQLVAFTQRLIRLALRWLINPIVEQQNAFQAAVTETIPPVIEADAELRAAIAAVRAQQAYITRQYNQQEMYQ